MICSSTLLFLSLAVSSYGGFTVITKSGDRKCTTPSKNPGDCRSLKNCSALKELLRQNQSTGWSFVRDSICGFEGLDSLVCCPSETSNTSEAPQELPVDLQGLERNPAMDYQCGQVNIQTDKIVGGENADLGEWPWLVALGYNSSHRPVVSWRCGGALVTRRHIITAAHCVTRSTSSTLSVVRLGDLNLNDNVDDGVTPEDIGVEKTFSHPDYSATSKENDIAVIKLKRDAPLSENIRPICLPTSSYFKISSLADEVAKVAGWGSLQFGGKSTTQLQEVELKIADNVTCINTYSKYSGAEIDNRVMCAGTPGKSACQGDSGGPLVLLKNSTYHLVGVVSYGVRCGDPSAPGVATRVSSFVDWITSNLD